MTLELRHLRVVVAIADHGSITGAARALGVPPPTLSTQLRRVERMTGRPLFTRRPEGVRPTRAGELVVERARATLDGVEALTIGLGETAAGAGDVADTVVVGGIASHWFAHFLAASMGRPGRRIEGRTDASTTVVDEWLGGGHVDVGVVGVLGHGDTDAPPGCRQVTVVESQPFLVALGSCHPLARRREISLTELHDTPWLLPRGHADGTMPAFLEACRRAGFRPHSPVGPADLTHYVPWVVDAGAACLASPSYPPNPGMVVVPLRDGVEVQIRMRWNPERLSEDEADQLAVELATAYVDQVLSVSSGAAWWHDVPDFRPRLAGHLRDRVPVGL